MQINLERRSVKIGSRVELRVQQSSIVVWGGMRKGGRDPLEKAFEQELRERGLARRQEIALSDNAYAGVRGLVEESGIVEQLSRRLEKLIFNYSLRQVQHRKAPPRAKIASALRAVATAAGQLQNSKKDERTVLETKLRSRLARPGVMRLLAGVIDPRKALAMDSNEVKNLEERLLANPVSTKRLATLCLQRGAGSRNKRHPGLPTNNPRLLDFTSELLRFWHLCLRRDIQLTGNRDDQSYSATVYFVQKCFELAGEYCTLEQVRMRISKAKKLMDAHDPLRSELDWAIEPTVSKKQKKFS